jgi:hypothetical protein
VIETPETSSTEMPIEGTSTQPGITDAPATEAPAATSETAPVTETPAEAPAETPATGTPAEAPAAETTTQ